MKAMRKLVWMLLAVSMVGFTSCDSDDDDWIDDGDKAVAVRTKEALLLPRVAVLMRILGMLPQQKKIKIPIISS